MAAEVGVAVGADVGEAVGEAVAVAVAVAVGGAVGVTVARDAALTVGMGEGDGVTVGRGVTVSVGDGVAAARVVAVTKDLAVGLVVGSAVTGVGSSSDAFVAVTAETLVGWDGSRAAVAMMKGVAVASAVGVSVGPNDAGGAIVVSGTPMVGETMAVSVATGAIAGAGVAIPVPPQAVATATPAPQRMTREKGTAAIIPGIPHINPILGNPVLNSVLTARG